jgi:hypothetical protein
MKISRAPVRIDFRERDPTIAVDRNAVERRPFERDDFGGLPLPVRVEQLRLDHMAGDAGSHCGSIAAIPRP